MDNFLEIGKRYASSNGHSVLIVGYAILRKLGEPDDGPTIKLFQGDNAVIYHPNGRKMDDMDRSGDPKIVTFHEDLLYEILEVVTS